MIIRGAQKGDETAILDLIKELAAFEKEPDAVINTAEKLREDLFVNNYCEALVAEANSKIIAFALFYTSYSTWKGPCLYLEDLYVREEHRGSGVGSQLFEEVCKIAKSRKVARMDWQVLDWNHPAIDFYKKYNAVLDPEWINGRLFFE